MALLQLPKKFHPDFINPRKQPLGPVSIDRSNPITKGILSAIIFNSFALRDSAGNVPQSAISREGTATTLNANATGLCVHYNDDTDDNGFIIDDVDTDFTIFDGDDSSYTICATMTYTGPDEKSSESVVLSTYSGSPGGTNDLLNGSSGTQPWTSMEDNKPHTIVVVRRPSGEGMSQLWMDGRLVEERAAQSITGKGIIIRYEQLSGGNTWEVYLGSGTRDAGGLYIGERPGGTDNWIGGINSTFMFKRALPEEEARSLSSAPYQIFKPAIPINANTPIVAGGLTITLAGKTSTATVGSLTTTTHIPAMAVGGLATTSAAGSLATTVHIPDMQVGGLASTSLMGALSLAQANVSIVLSGLSSTSQIGGLGTKNDIVIAPVASSSIVGSLSLTQGTVTILPASVGSSSQVGAVILGDFVVVGDAGFVQDLVQDLTSDLVKTLIN